jgi:GSH-dependent disulfide-bond oxidoreductase
MYQLYAERSPNVFKVALFLEEIAAEWAPIWTDVSSGAQFAPDFIALSPNGRIPVLIDTEPVDGGAPQTLWESGAILQYLAEKYGRFLSRDPRTRTATMMWLFWQMAGLGPMAGQNAHFAQYRELLPGTEYSATRYKKETRRLCSVLERRLLDRSFIVGEYSIADMACFPWVRLHAFLGIEIEAFPAIRRWMDAIAQRPASVRAYAKIEALPKSDKTVEQRFKAMCSLQ